MKHICMIGLLFLLNTAADGAVWTSGPAMLERCADQVAEAHGTDIYVFGGWNPSNTYLATAQKYDTISGQWSLLSPMPAGRTNAASVIVEDRIHVIGGLVSYNTVSADVLTFDTSTQTWGTAASLPEPLVSACAVHADDRIWVIGGVPDFTTGDASAVVYVSNDLVASGGVVTGWTTHAQALPSPLVYHAADVIQGIIHVTGGADNFTYESGVVSDAIYAMDPAVGTWARVGTLPEPVMQHAGVGFGEWLFSFGGYDDPNYLAGTSAFSTLTSLVTPGTPVPLPTFGMRAVVVGELIYLLGGYDEVWWEGSNECRIYDPVADGFTDPVPLTGNPCPDILGVYFDEPGRGNCMPFYFTYITAHVVITNPTVESVVGVEFGYRISTSTNGFYRTSETIPPGAWNWADSSNWEHGDYYMGSLNPLPSGGQSVVCVSWTFLSSDPSADVSFYLTASNFEGIPDEYPAYTDGEFPYPLGYASGDPNVPVAVFNGICLDPATVTIIAQPNGLDAPWQLDVPGTPHDLTGTGDAVLEDLPGGGYTITWGDVFGYASPAAVTETLDVPFGGATTFTGLYSEIISGVPDIGQPAASLHQNFPNPFNPSTRLSFELVRAGQTRLAVYDATGRVVRTLVDGHRAEGRHDVSWDGRDEKGRKTPAGVYLYRLQSGDIAETRSMVLLK